ncbi:MAG: ABC transporter ATP-binding protein, partial [Candidatus Zixiibacteriota bacterium]
MKSGTINKETELSTRQAWSKLLPLFAPYKLGIAGCVLLLMAVAGLTISKGLLIRRAIDDNMGGKDWGGLLLTVGLYLGAQGALLVVTYVQRIKLEKIGQRIIADLKERLFGKLLGLSLSFFDRNAPGRLMARVESDTDSLRMLFTFAITVIIGDLILIVALFTTMFIISPHLTVIIATAIPVTLGLTYVYDKLTSERFLRSRKVMAEITSRITEFLQGIAVTQIFNRTDYARSRVLEVNREKFRLDRFVHITSTTYFNIVFFMEALLIAAVLFWGGGWVAQGALTIGVIIMFVQ